jgi:acylpyruvate hydrolase
MRFATIRTDQGTTAARLDGDVLTPLEAGDVGAMLTAGGAARERDGVPAVPAAQADFAPVVTRPSKIICVGLNYRSHILETGRELPEYPTLFAKFAETLLGPRDDLVIPSVSERVDWEVELGVVIGLTRTASTGAVQRRTGSRVTTDGHARPGRADRPAAWRWSPAVRPISDRPRGRPTGPRRRGPRSPTPA